MAAACCSTSTASSIATLADIAFLSVVGSSSSNGACIKSTFVLSVRLSTALPKSSSRGPTRPRVTWRAAYSGDVQNGASSGSTYEDFPERWDVVGLGQAMVDFSGMVGDQFLDNLQLEKGIRKVVNHEERGKVLSALSGHSFKASAGGSLSNTLVALARLGSATSRYPEVRVAMMGSVGSDPLGHFYRAKLLKAHVRFLSPPIVEGTTGTVIVLTTPDAQRTMFSYAGMSSVVNFDATLSRAISAARVLVVEGYLWELPQTIDAIVEACDTAHRNGVLVALTASDVSCIVRHRKQFWDLMASRADIVFTNSNEAKALCGLGADASARLAACLLSQHCPFVSVTDGAQGSYLGVTGQVTYVSPAACVPVDTCGAGDAYAAGVLYGILMGVSDLKGMGNLAARVAAVVVGQQGTRLKQRDALHLTESFFTNSTAAGDRLQEDVHLCAAVDTDKSANL
ncbi:hypothetical protein L7F22_062400 [Adiantum nelumboides]|nr:hypothetical protein [Adiantum nelumboides]